MKTAKGVTELEVCHGFIEVMSEETSARTLISDDIEIALIGLTVLESLNLEVDPITTESLAL